MESLGDNRHHSAYPPLQEPGYARDATKHALRIILYALVVILLSWLSPIKALSANDHSMTGAFASFPLPSDSDAYPGPTDAPPPPTPTGAETPEPPSPTPQSPTPTRIERTPTAYPSREIAAQPTTATVETVPEREQELETPARGETPAEQELSDDQTPTTTPTPERYVKALPTIARPSADVSPGQKGPLIPQELFACSVAFLVLFTIVLGIHLIRSRQDASQ